MDCTCQVKRSGSYFSFKMEIIRSNFNEKLPVIEQAIQEASFISIDGEFTGLNSGKGLHGFDTPEGRYHKIREGAMDFLLVQFGLNTFKYIEHDNSYEVKAFNFYIFPRPFGRQCPDVKFFCQSSSMDFLAQVGFDFNKLFKDGISYLSSIDEIKLREQLEQRHQQQFTSPRVDSDETLKCIVPDEHKKFIDEVCNKVTNLMNSDEQSVQLEPCNAFLRKLIYQNVKSKFKSGIHIDTKKKDERERYIVITKADEDKMKEMENEKKNLEINELEEAVGFSKVIRMISKSEKLVVGHNMLLDVCHILHQFSSPLPADYEEFKLLAKYVLPKLLDTKLLASSQPLRDLINSTTLGELHTLLEKSPFVQPKIILSEGFPPYTKTTGKLHEAGYDAFVTGVCFVTMANYLGSSQNAKNKLSFNSSLLEPFMNKIFLMRVQDIPYINLVGEDLSPSRSHVFHVKFPKEWKTSDLVQLFSPFGSVYVAWVDDNSAFVSLNKKDQAKVVMKTLTQSDTYHVQTYANFANVQQKQSTHSWSESLDGSSVWPTKKRSLPEHETNISVKRKRSKINSEEDSLVQPGNEFPDGEKEQKLDASGGATAGEKKKKKNGPTGKEKKNGPKDSSSDKIFEEDDVWE